MSLKFSLNSIAFKERSRTSFKSIVDIHIGSIANSVKGLEIDIRTSEVETLLKKNREAVGYCITEGEKVVGVINRGHLNSKLSGPYGYCLYSNKPITEIMEKDFLKVDYTTPIDRVAKVAMSRDYEKLYDFITVTKDEKYCGIVTVKDLLEKTMEIEVFNAKQLNPLSGLPGNIAIERELQDSIRSEKRHCVLYLDIDNFKAYNDVYGFENGDKIIKLLAEIIRGETREGEFAGHIGGDDFVVVVPEERSEDAGNRIAFVFDREIKSLYNREDIEKGFIFSKNRYGVDEIFPIMSLSVAGIIGNSVEDIYELGEAASRVKNRCKQAIGSTVIIEK